MPQRCRRKDLTEQVGQLAPLGILAAVAHIVGQLFRPRQRFDLKPEFGDGAGGRGLVEDFLFDLGQLVVRRILQIFEILGAELGAFCPTFLRWRGECLRLASLPRLKRGSRRTGLPQLQLTQAALQPLTAAAQGLIDSFRRRGQAPLQDGEREPNRPRPLIVL